MQEQDTTPHWSNTAVTVTVTNVTFVNSVTVLVNVAMSVTDLVWLCYISC